jgi:hypothetical protein
MIRLALVINLDLESEAISEGNLLLDWPCD